MFNLISPINFEIYCFERDKFHVVFYLLTSDNGYAKKHDFLKSLWFSLFYLLKHFIATNVWEIFSE